ncbi:hypothetical protein IW262DRAFT_491039 [Armillaria fumosa]|nr:hypothetical protein IW262DRAFT_491039 [Armillaria fumosa]
MGKPPMNSNSILALSPHHLSHVILLLLIVVSQLYAFHPLAFTASQTTKRSGRRQFYPSNDAELSLFCVTTVEGVLSFQFTSASGVPT